MITWVFLTLLTVCNAFPAAVGNPLANARNNPNVRLSLRGEDWDYQNWKIRGVNLGGWFVLEPYINPSLFDVWLQPGDDSQVPVDEYHYCQKLGKEQCQQNLNEHWNTWYTESDFALMKQKGLNLVRIPIGYWAFQLLDNDPYVQGQQAYFDQALLWCRKYGLKAWVDLHGAPGSQNGFDNSGLRDQIDFQQGNNAQVLMQVLEQVFAKYGHDEFSDVVIGIELINEPLGPKLDMDELKSFYYSGYDSLRGLGLTTPMIIHDAFMPMNYWDNDFKVDNGDYWGVVVDHHHYQAFSGPELQRDIWQHIDVACEWGTDAKTESHWNVCGEWLAALTDCARWLNGVGRGARLLGDYDGVQYIQSCAPYIAIEDYSDDHKASVRRYVEAQLDAFEQTGGWIFWNWKCESADEWDFKRLTDAGLFPQPLDNRQYPNQCRF